MPFDFDIHGLGENFVVTFNGKEVACWPTLTGAARGLTLAKQAKAELERVLRLSDSLVRKGGI